METQSPSLVSTTPPTKPADDADQVLLAARVFRKRLLGFEVSVVLGYMLLGKCHSAPHCARGRTRSGTY